MHNFSLPEEINDIYGKMMHAGIIDRGFSIHIARSQVATILPASAHMYT
jgi:hypothetical protein